MNNKGGMTPLGKKQDGIGTNKLAGTNQATMSKTTRRRNKRTCLLLLHLTCLQLLPSHRPHHQVYLPVEAMLMQHNNLRNCFDNEWNRETRITNLHRQESPSLISLQSTQGELMAPHKLTCHHLTPPVLVTVQEVKTLERNRQLQVLILSLMQCRKFLSFSIFKSIRNWYCQRTRRVLVTWMNGK